MSRAASVPAETDLLCEGCGYVLNGLPADARCPECGKPADESSPQLRSPPAWERRGDIPAVAGFFDTTGKVLLVPGRFFRTLAARPLAPSASAHFARIHWLLSAVLLGSAAFAHFEWFGNYGAAPRTIPVERVPVLVLFVATAYLFLLGLTRLAARLTTFEATHRGLRLPLPVVLRGLHFHGAHYLPVALVAAVTVIGYQVLLARGVLSALSGERYLYVLCAEVVFGAMYLFKTYWTAMRNLMYANR